MMKLVIGQTYFLVGFHDSKLSQPCINTVVYEGVDTNKEIGHVFKVLTDGSYVCFQETKINNILDKDNLIKWLQRDHSPKMVGETYLYKH